MNKQNNMINYICLGLTVCFLSCSSPTEIDFYTDVIASVEDGATLKLNGGLTVQLCGLNPQSTFCQEQLEKFIGQEIELIHDSQYEESFVDTEESIYAYAKVTNSGIELNRYILSAAGEKGFYTGTVNDSLNAYKELFKKNISNLDDEQMCSMMRACSMLVFGTDGNQQWVGTAFFISKDGLALSCNHVINHGTITKVCISNSKGEINVEQGYGVNSIAHADKDLDYVVFYVNLDDEARRNLKFMPLAKEVPVGGTKVGVMGNPLGEESLLMSYSSGTVSGNRPKIGKIQINAPITHGFSGGPVCNNHGEIIGIAQSGIETQDAGTIANLNFAVDIQQVRHWLDENNKAYAGK